MIYIINVNYINLVQSRNVNHPLYRLYGDYPWKTALWQLKQWHLTQWSSIQWIIKLV